MDHWLIAAAARRPDRLALVSARGGLSYKDLALRAGVAARALLARGVQPGDRVALKHEDDVEFALALHACLLVGARAVPIDLRLSGEERAARAAGAMLIVEPVPLEPVPLEPVPLAPPVVP